MKKLIKNNENAVGTPRSMGNQSGLKASKSKKQSVNISERKKSNKKGNKETSLSTSEIIRVY